MPLSMGWDLAAASFTRIEPKVTGRPGYAPADLLKLYIYGYLNRVRSSRRLQEVVASGDGVIYAFTRDGRILWYRYGKRRPGSRPPRPAAESRVPRTSRHATA